MKENKKYVVSILTNECIQCYATENTYRCNDNQNHFIPHDSWRRDIYTLENIANDNKNHFINDLDTAKKVYEETNTGGVKLIEYDCENEENYTVLYAKI